MTKLKFSCAVAVFGLMSLLLLPATAMADSWINLVGSPSGGTVAINAGPNNVTIYPGGAPLLFNNTSETFTDLTLQWTGYTAIGDTTVNPPTGAFSSFT